MHIAVSMNECVAPNRVRIYVHAAAEQVAKYYCGKEEDHGIQGRSCAMGA